VRAVFAVPLLAAAGSLAAEPWTIEAVMRIRTVVDFRVSPDGSRLLYVLREWDPPANRYRHSLWVLPTAGGPARLIQGFGPADGQPRWSPDGERLAFVSARSGSSQIQVMTLEGAPRKITDAPRGVNSFTWSPDGREIAYLAPDPPTAAEAARQARGDDAVVADRDYKYARLYRVAAAGGPARLATRADRHIVSFSWSPDGKRIAYAAQPTPRPRDLFHSDVFELNLATAQERAVVQQDGRDGEPAYAPDGRTIVFHSQMGSLNYFGERHIAVAPPGGGAVRYLTRGFAGDVFRGGNAYAWRDGGRKLLFTAGKGTRDFLYELDIASGATRQAAEWLAGPAFSASRDGTVLAWLGHRDHEPPDLYVNGQRRTRLNPEVARHPAIETRLLRWKSKDGLDIEGVLRLPVGYRPGQRVALLVELHGGPTGVALEGFPLSRYYPAQVFAQRGFAVLAPNFRGSANYGAEFRLANIQSQGFGDAEDVYAGIDLLVKEGIADPERLGVMGWSYGGYLASFLIGVSSRFRAAAIGATAADWTGYYGMNEGPRETLWTYFGGKPWDRLATYARHSPRTYLNHARTPALLLRGELDFDSTAEVYRALSDLGVPVEFVTYPREGHGIAEPAHQRDLMARHLRWFEHWLKP
jgi:dipeptidyl aminopeptidase/acylaminoacyl peptidase